MKRRTAKQIFWEMYESSCDAHENFNDFADDKAIIWAGKTIKKYEEKLGIKEKPIDKLEE